MTEADPQMQEGRLARQLGRLFRIERVGALDRRGPEVRRRVIEHRAVLLSELLRLADRGRNSASPLSSALAELAQEVCLSLRVAHSRVERLGRDLRLRLGEGQATGVRDNPNGRFLGKS